MSSVLTIAVGVAQDVERGRSFDPQTAAQRDGERHLVVSSVGLSSATFNPSDRGTLRLLYRLARDSAVTVNVYGPDNGLVRTLVQGVRRNMGSNQELWDGKDLAGKIVPNEAYFFNIETVDSSVITEVYDPTTFSGGEFGEITRGEVSRGGGTVSYQLSQPSRVLLRAGIAGSAMLKTIVDWEPRPAGAVTEYWNGKDEDNLIDLLGRKYTMILSYMTLPETSVITYGNINYTYREYRALVKRKPEIKSDRGMTNNRKLSPHFLKSPLTDRSFKVKLGFSTLDRPGAKDVPEARDRVVLRLDIDPKDREVIENQQFEIILFVDTVFYIEEERGYLPFNIPIELKDLPPGEHVITANVITFGDQIGVGSRKVRVVK